MQEKKFYYLKQGRAKGPISVGEVKDLLAKKELGLLDLICQEISMNSWRFVVNFEEFHNKGNVPDMESKVWVILKILGEDEYKQQGPYSGNDIRALLKSKDIELKDYIWCRGMTEWYKISSINIFSRGIEKAKTKKIYMGDSERKLSGIIGKQKKLLYFLRTFLARPYLRISLGVALAFAVLVLAFYGYKKRESLRPVAPLTRSKIKDIKKEKLTQKLPIEKKKVKKKVLQPSYLAVRIFTEKGQPRLLVTTDVPASIIKLTISGRAGKVLGVKSFYKVMSYTGKEKLVIDLKAQGLLAGEYSFFVEMGKLAQFKTYFVGSKTQFYIKKIRAHKKQLAVWSQIEKRALYRGGYLLEKMAHQARSLALYGGGGVKKRQAVVAWKRSLRKKTS